LVFPIILLLVFCIPVYWGLSRALENYRAVHGVRGTLTVDDCFLVDPCTGSFVSDDGQLRIDHLPTPDRGHDVGDTVQGWVTGPGATKLYPSVEWRADLGGAAFFVVVALIVGYFIFSGHVRLRIRRVPNDQGTRSFAAVTAAAQQAELGRHQWSVRWSRYRYALVAFIAGWFAVGFAVAGVADLRSRPSIGLPVGAGVAGLVALGFGATTFGLLRRAVAGVNRSLHLFEHGLVVGHGRRCDVYAWRSLAEYTALHDEDGTTSGILLRRLDGRRLEIDLEGVAQSILPTINAERSRAGQ
jgi:hypothetical protein